VKNVVFSWAGQGVFIVAGFIMPRLIDQNLGRDMLGVWDFCWALANYFYFIQGGVTSAVNRYVGRYWSTQDIAGISRVVSCATASLSVAGLAIALVSGLACFLVPSIFAERLAGHADEARWVVLLLGLSLAVQTAFGAFNGVITGCHRWDLKNLIHAGWYAVAAVAMAAVLLLGGSLSMLALIVFLSECLGQATRALFSFRICQGLRLGPRLVDRATIRELHSFGARALLPQITNMVKGTTTSMLIVIYLGPGALALVMRPQSLVRHVNTMVRRMTLTLVPTVSSLEAAGKAREIRGLLIRAVRYTLYLELPVMLGLAVFGAPIVELWMGPEYARWGLIAAIMLLSIIPGVAMPMTQVLGGLNAHGRAGLGQLVGALVSIIVVFITLRSGGGVVGAVMGVLVPVNMVALIYLPYLAARRIGMRTSTFVWKAILTPIVQLLPLGFAFLAIRLAMFDNPIGAMIASAAVLGPVTGYLYWRYVLPVRLKEGLMRVVCRRKASTLLS